MRKNYASIFLLLFLGLTSFQAHAQCGSCGDGSEGAFDATVNTTLAGGVHNFTSFHIAPGVTVRATGTTALEILATGTVNIQGTLDVRGLNGADGVTYTNGGAGALGVAGGGNGGAGSFDANNGPFDGAPASGSGAGGIGQGWSGGGGAGYAAVGGSTGGVGGFGGMTYGAPDLTGNTTGSGGGGGSGGYNCGAGGGGAGGGFVKIFSCVAVDISGTINADGGAGGSDGTGNCGGGGGGSGGSIWLAGTTVNVTGALTAQGGAGGLSTLVGGPYFGIGGVGSVGRIRIDGTANVTGSATPAVGFFGTIPNPASVTASGTDISCFGGTDGSASATGVGTGSLQYLWNNGSTTPNLIGLAPGCYTVFLTDSLGCTATDTICITQPAVLDVTLFGIIDNACNGDCQGEANITATGGTPTYSVNWSNGSTSVPQTNLCAGNYDVTVTDSHGCSDTASFTISEPAPISLSLTSTNASSGTATDGSASVVAAGGTAPYGYLWTPAGGSSATATNLAAGTYTVQVIDSNGCTSSDTVVVGITVSIANPSGLAFSLFPNPTQGQLTLSLVRDEASPLTLSIFDAQGKLLRQENLGTAQALRTPLDISAFPAGVYHIRVAGEHGYATQRVTLTR